MKRALMVLGMVVLLACVTAAKPRPKLFFADARIGAVCAGPATMTGCLISVFDSTAGIALATNTPKVKGDTLWITRPCLTNGTIVVGGQFIGTRAGASNSAPVGARGQGECSAQAGQPSPVIVVQVQ